MRATLDIRQDAVAVPDVNYTLDDPNISDPAEMWEKLGVELGYISRITVQELRPMKRKTTIIEEYE